MLIGFIIHLTKFKTMRNCCCLFETDLGEIRLAFTMNWLMILWKHGREKIFQLLKQLSSDTEVDIPPNPIEEFNEVVQNIQFSHEEPYENMNEQFVALESIEDQEDDCTEDLY
jgi:hypothetical protein